MGRNVATGVVVLLTGLALGLPGAAARALDTTTVIVQVIGRGTVSGGGGQINCGDGSKSCYATYVSGPSVTLTVTPAVGWTFAGWDDSYDGCAGTSPTCTVPLDGATHEEAGEFTPVTPVGTTNLTVTEPTGGGVGGGEIDCGSGSDDCEWDEITTGSTVTLVETPAAGYSFSGWGGACSGTAKSCTVTMDADRSVSATFSQSATVQVLNVLVTGSGTVTGGGIACTSTGGSGCTASEPAGSQVTLTATPASGAQFTGWGGACAGTSTTCTVSMTGDQSVTAAFSGGIGATVPLTVSVSGGGKVTGTGIDCGNGATTCNANVATGSSVALTATPASGATFQGWGGACSGAASTCTLTMDAAKAVSATFTGTTPPTGNLTLTLRVVGNGVVTAPGGTCAGGGGTNTCAQSYAPGASVLLNARPNPGARFVGWSGDCSGTKTTCSLTLGGAKTVTATFTRPAGASSAGALRSRGRPIVERARSGFGVTLRFTTSRQGTAHVRALRAGRVVASFSFPVTAGPVTIGPFRVAKPGYYTFEVALGPRRIAWKACLGRCGAAAAGRPFTVESEAASVVDAGAVWSVTLHFRTTLPADVELRVYRGTTLALAYHFAPPAGRRSAGPFLLSPGTYTLRLTATDAFGRARTLTWIAFLP